MTDAEAARAAVAELTLAEIADAIEDLGFACTDCGACCRSGDDEEHVATVFPHEIRRIGAGTDSEWRDVARPMPFGLDDDGGGETFEWSLQVNGCGDCTFYRPDGDGGGCGIYADRPLLCRTYPFQLAVPGVAQPGAAAVDRVGAVIAYECEGLGRSIDRDDALALARALKRRARNEIDQHERLIARYEPRSERDGPVVHDSEGAKAADGTPLDSGAEETTRYY